VARKIKTVIVENGFEKEVEIEVPDGPPAAWGDLNKLRILGKRNPRPDGPDKVSGRAKYASDIVLPGMCYARYVMSTYAAGKLNALDTSAAEKIPGVKGVMKLMEPGAQVMFAGQPLAVVAAITPELAEDAVRAVRVDISAQPFVVDMVKAMDPRSPKVRADTPSNVQFPGKTEEGDVDGIFARCAVVHEATYEAQTRLHCCLETHGNTVKWDGPKLTAWSSTQHIEGCKGDFAREAGGPQNVTVICEHMGGGFGSKFGAGPEGIAAARLAKQINAPVKFMLSRAEEQYANFRGPGARAEVKLGAAADGTLLVTQVKAYNNGGVANANTPLDSGFYIIGPKPVTVKDATGKDKSVQPRRVERTGVLTNTGGTAALRAPGHPQAAVVWDMAMDELAAKLNMDPLDFRRKNHSDPVRVKEWEIGAQVIGWDRRQKTPGSAPGVKKRGIGMGSASWFGGGRQSADCTIVVAKDGSIKSMCGVQDLGTGLRTYVASIVAEELGLEVKDVTPLIGDTNYGKGHGSGGSTTTPSVAPAVKMAAMDAKEKLALVAAKELGAKPEDIEVVLGGKFQVKGQPAKSIAWKQLCQKLPAAGLKAHGEWNSDLQQGGAAGCNFAEVEVDTETGKVTVLKVVGIQDCGFVLNRLQAENQCTGGMIQGIGTALLEERRMDNLTGRMLNPNLEEYKLCGAMEAGGVNITMDAPYRTLGVNERGICAIIYDNPTGKVTGIGEPSIIGVQASIANAIYNATGAMVREMPATPDKVLAALGRKGARA
jgi:xanthine dehydrogenase YagR molybdenum-binding subunit